jgi:hypothetical protein
VGRREGSHRDDLAAFYPQRFRPEFTTAFDAWLATHPLTDPDAPETPLAMSEYQPAAKTAAQDLDRQSESSAVVVSRNIQRPPTTWFHGARLRTITLVVGCAVFLATASRVASMPVNVSV